MAQNPYIRDLEKLAAEIPKINCQKKCQECCGPILMTGLEMARTLKRLEAPPKGTEDLTCPMLNRTTGECRVYSVRPLICRLWGVAQGMECPWGCKPERYLTKAEAHDLLHRVDDLSQRMAADPIWQAYLKDLAKQPTVGQAW